MLICVRPFVVLTNQHVEKFSVISKMSDRLHVHKGQLGEGGSGGRRGEGWGVRGCLTLRKVVRFRIRRNEKGVDVMTENPEKGSACSTCWERERKRDAVSA